MRKNVFCLFVLAFVLISCRNNDRTRTDAVASPQAGTDTAAQNVTPSYPPGTAFDIVFNVGDGSGTAPGNWQALPGGTIVLPDAGSMAAPPRMRFAGWETEGWFYKAGKEFMITKDMTFTAVWMSNPDTRSYSNLTYVPAANGGTADHQLGLWLPDSGVGPFPVVIYVTGGGFMMSSRGQPPGYYAQARARGYAVASVQHRVNGTANDGGKFPNQTLDVLAAIRFLRANADTYNLDKNRFVITGHSAGGYQTHMVTALSNSPGGLAMLDPDNVLDTLGNPGVSTDVLAGVSWAGLSDLSKLQAQHAASGITPMMAHHIAGGPCVGLLATSSMLPVTDVYDPKLADALRRSNPLEYVHINMPPLITQASRDDNVVPYQSSLIMAEKIIEVCGNDRVRHDLFDGQGHNTLQNVYFPDGGGSNMTMIMDFIDLHMKF